MSGQGDKVDIIEDIGKSPHLDKSTAMSLSSDSGQYSGNFSATAGVSEHAQRGYQEGGNSYDKFRPGYTPETVSFVAGEIQAMSENSTQTAFNIVELGAGTGKFTELLVRALPSSVKYLAVEQSADFCRTLQAKDLPIEVVVGEAANIPAGDASVENLVCAEAFHWFSDAEHLKELRRVLVRGGNLVIVFNFRDYSKDWMQEFYKQRLRVHKRIGDSLKHVVFSMEWRKDIDASPLFSLATEKSLPGFKLTGTVEDIIRHCKTQQFFQQLPEEEMEENMEELRNVLRNWPGLDLNNIVYPLISKVYVYKAQ